MEAWVGAPTTGVPPLGERASRVARMRRCKSPSLRALLAVELQQVVPRQVALRRAALGKAELMWKVAQRHVALRRAALRQAALKWKVLQRADRRRAMSRRVVLRRVAMRWQASLAAAPQQVALR